MRYIYLLSILCWAISPAAAQQFYYENGDVNARRVEVGNAVYYADYLAGRTTALGEAYRPEEYTAAHPSYPKGTLLRVVRLDNGQSVIVRVNDRGPYGSDAIIDLSKAAAMDIGLLRDGRARVRLEVVGRSDQNPPRGQLTRSQQRAQPQAYNRTETQVNSPQEYYRSYPPAAPRSSYRSVAPDRSEDFTAKGMPSAYDDGARTRYPSDRQPDAYNRYYEPQPRQRDAYRNPYAGYQNRSQAYPQEYNNTYANRGLQERSPAPARTAEAAGTSVKTLPSVTTGYAVQLASYKNRSNAVRQIQQLQGKGLSNVFIWQQGGYHRVIIAAFPNKTAAQQYLDSVRRAYQMDGLVVKVG